jgi:hypothetical protein
MTNTNAQHLNYSPQIPRLRPEDLRNQSMLDRLTDHLNSLILIPGEGIEISRQGSAGTVLTARQAGSSGEVSRKVTKSISGTSYYIVSCPAITCFVNQGGLSGGVIIKLIPSATFTFTIAFPDYVGISFNGLGGGWVHSSSNGTDAGTKAAYFEVNTFLKMVAAVGNYGSIVTPIPYLLSSQQVLNNGYGWLKAGTALTVRVDSINPDVGAWQWKSHNGANVFTFSVGGSITLTPSMDTSVYYKVENEWYKSATGGGGSSVTLVDSSGITTSGFMYFKAGDIKTDADNNLIKASWLTPLPPYIPFDDSTGTYANVTVNNGIVTSGT